MASSVSPHKCHLKYHPYSYFSRDPARRVTGIVQDESGNPKLQIVGTWDEKLDFSDISKVIDANAHKFDVKNTKSLWKKVKINLRNSNVTIVSGTFEFSFR